MKKKLFSLFTSIIMVISLVGVVPVITASAYTYGAYTYSILSDGTIEISKYNGYAHNLTIPATIAGKKVTKIGFGSLGNNNNLQVVKLPSTIKIIDDNAFRNDFNLKSINIPNGTQRIGDFAFLNCEKLLSLTIPKSVIEIGFEAIAIGMNHVNGVEVWIPYRDFMLKCYEGSAAEKYAKDNVINYQLVLPIVTSFKASSTSASAVKLTWKKAKGAQGYTVYQKKSGKWVKVKSLKDTNLTVKKLKAGTTYQFGVKAYKKVNGIISTSAKQATLKTSTKPAKVNFKLTAGSKKATVKWSKVTGATGYIVYYKTSKNGSWKKLKTTTGTSYTKTGLTKGKTYWFTVKAYRKVDGKTYNGAFTTKTVKVK